MADLLSAEARRTPSALAQQLAESRAQVKLLQSSRAKLRRGQFAPQSIPASALSASAAPGVVSLTATSFAVTTDGVVVAQAEVTVPAGMRGCVVSVTGRVYAINSTGAADYLLARTEVEASQSNVVPVLAMAGAGAVNVAPIAVVLRDLQGGTSFTLRVWARSTTAAWAADASNLVDLQGSLGWFS